MPRVAWSFKSFALMGAAVMVLVVGVFEWLDQAAPVSAQQVLDRAAAPGMAPNQAVHRSYKLEQRDGKPSTGTGGVWVQADARGNIFRSAMTFAGFYLDGTVLNIERVLIVAAFLAPIKAQWDVDVAAGKITAAQETEDLTNFQKKLGIWVTIPLGKK